MLGQRPPTHLLYGSRGPPLSTTPYTSRLFRRLGPVPRAIATTTSRLARRSCAADAAFRRAHTRDYRALQETCRARPNALLPPQIARCARCSSLLQPPRTCRCVNSSRRFSRPGVWVRVRPSLNRNLIASSAWLRQARKPSQGARCRPTRPRSSTEPTVAVVRCRRAPGRLATMVRRARPLPDLRLLDFPSSGGKTGPPAQLSAPFTRGPARHVVPAFSDAPPTARERRPAAPSLPWTSTCPRRPRHLERRRTLRLRRALCRGSRGEKDREARALRRLTETLEAKARPIRGLTLRELARRLNDHGEAEPSSSFVRECRARPLR